MSRILQRGDTGFGLLIENDAGFIDLSLNKDTILNETFKPELGSPLFLDCTLQKWGIENKNGRIYPENILRPQIDEYVKFMKELNSAIGEADHPDCITASDSMIYTKNGWKLFGDISNDEEILTLNTETNKIEIQKIEKRILEDYRGDMYHFKSKTDIDLIATPNHRFLLLNPQGNYVYYSAEEIYNNRTKFNKYRIPRTNSNWEGLYSSYFILNKKTKFKLRTKQSIVKQNSIDLKIKSENWFAFLGIYLAEGYVDKRSSKIQITQRDPVKILKIETLLNQLPFNVHKNIRKNGTVDFHIYDLRLHEYLKPLDKSYKKYVPNEIKQASPDLLNILLHWFQLGDGRKIKLKDGGERNSIFSTSKKLIEDFREILLKIGKSGNITVDNKRKDRIIKDRKVLVLEDGSEEVIFEERLIKSENSRPLYNLNLSTRNNIGLNKRFVSINKINYEGKIGCVRVPNGNFYVLRNGRGFWTGNSSVVSLDNVAHRLVDINWGQGDQAHICYGKIELIVSDSYMKGGAGWLIGDKLYEYLKRGIRLGISSRGIGTLEDINGKSIVQNDFELICFDLVASPSTPGAYLYPLGPKRFGENSIKEKEMINNIYTPNTPDITKEISENEKFLLVGLNEFLLKI